MRQQLEEPVSESVPTFAEAKGERVWKMAVPSMQEVFDLPVRLPWAQAARILGYGRWAAYKAVEDGTWPADVPIITIGRARMVSLTDLMRHLGITASSTDAAAAEQHR